MASTPEFRKAFVERLVAACDANPAVPLPNDGRQSWIAHHLQVVPEAVSKWFKGVSMPRPEKMQRLAALLGVDVPWLAYGESPELDRKQRQVQARESSGAVHLVWGMFTLAGGRCGEPPEGDPQASFIDFYVTLRGVIYPIHVALAREIEGGEFEFTIPAEFERVYVIGVVPLAGGRFHFLRFPARSIEQVKQRKQGAYRIAVERRDTSRYCSGKVPWPRIRCFDAFV